MGQAIQIYETYGWEILGALLLIAVILLVVQMVRLKNLREQVAQLAKQVREGFMYAPKGRKAADDSFQAFTQEENRQRRQQLTKELDERSQRETVNLNTKEKSRDQDQNELISSVLEEIFP